MTKITHIQMKTIIPLHYDREKFIKCLSEENGIFYDESPFNKVRFRKGNYYEKGQKLFTEDEREIYVAKLPNPRDAGLENKGVKYMTCCDVEYIEGKRKKMSFTMGDIFIFFHHHRAYLVLIANISVDQWEEDVNIEVLYNECLKFFAKNLDREGEKVFYNGDKKYSYKSIVKSICKNDIMKKIGVNKEEAWDNVFLQCNLLSIKIPQDSEIYGLMKELVENGDTKENTFLSGDWQKVDNNTKRTNKLFWGYGNKQLLIAPNQEFQFTDGPSSPFYSSVNKNYMSLYTLWIDCRIGLLESNGDSKIIWSNIRALMEGLLIKESFGHINDIFSRLVRNIVDNPRKVAISLKKDLTEGDYIFVSYSHKDFVRVYCDLYTEIKTKELPVWYDTGLYENADEEWHKYIESIVRSDKCKGVIFYLSKNAMLSKNVKREVEIALEENKKYFVIGLSDSIIPGAILKEALYDAEFSQVTDNDFMEMVQVMAKAFPNTKTILNPNDSKYYEQIETNISKFLQ